MTTASATQAESKNEPVVSVRGLRKFFQRADGSTVPAIDGINIDVQADEFVVLLGASGCGKTTLLRSIAGLERPDDGEIDIHGKTMFSSDRRIDASPAKRELSMIFQSYALWPNMTAFQNVAYPLQNRRIPKQEIDRRVRRILDLVGVGELADQHPTRMSGGQQQRVSMARALVAGDALVLFDEPLSNVDAKVRDTLRAELASMQRELGFTAIYVTHDQTEAMELADKIVVLRSGVIEQTGSPREIYERPATRYVANFVGRITEFEGKISAIDESGRVTVDTEIGPILSDNADESSMIGDRVVAAVRPESWQLDSAASAINSWDLTIGRSVFLGAVVDYTLTTQGGTSVLASVPARMALNSDVHTTRASAIPQNVLVYPA